MELQLSKSTTLAVIQKEFNTVFNFLKLEFFKRSHKKGEANSAKELIKNAQKQLGELGFSYAKKTISIDPKMKVSELEEAFEKEFGLHVQVFRKSGRSWLETTATDSWSLEKQNAEGKELSDFNSSKEDQEQDWD